MTPPSPPAGQKVPIAATHIYELSFITGFFISTSIYLVLNLLSPPTGLSLSSLSLHWYSKSFKEIDETGWEEGGRPDDQPGLAREVGGGSDSADSVVRVRGVGKRDSKGDYDDDDEDKTA